jgi:hypothetical protein
MELYLHQNGERVGPYTEDQISAMLASGRVSRNDIVWHERLTEWQPIHVVFSLPAPVSPPAPILQAKLSATTSPQPLFKKIRLGSSLAALVLFGLPWIDIQCSEKSMVTQTGFQAIYGGASMSDEMRAQAGRSGTDDNSNSGDSMGSAPLLAIALIAILGAVAHSGIALFRGGDRAEYGWRPYTGTPCIALLFNRDRAECFSSILPAVALGLLLMQLMLGFPAKKKVLESMSQKPPESKSVDDPFSGLGESMAAAMMMNIRVKTTPVFYFELLALGIPTLLLVNGFIDKRRKESEQAAP